MKTTKFLIEYKLDNYKQVIEISNKFELQAYLVDIIKRHTINTSGVIYRKNKTIAELILESMYNVNIILHHVKDIFNIHKDHIEAIAESFGIHIQQVDDMEPEYKNFKINHVMEEIYNKIFVSVTPDVYDAILNNKKRDKKYQIVTPDLLAHNNYRWYITTSDKNTQLKYTPDIRGSEGYIIHFNYENYNDYFKLYNPKGNNNEC